MYPVTPRPAPLLHALQDCAPSLAGGDSAVLVLGIYLADKPNHMGSLVQNLSSARTYRVVQRWIALGEATLDPRLRNVTQAHHTTFSPKFALINQLLQRESLDVFEYVVILDDDVLLPDRFLDGFLKTQAGLNFRLAQPARTTNSYIDHPIVGRVEGSLARQTRFVESGPVLSFHRSIFPLVFPFDMTSPMGWGYENVWAYRLQQHGFAMGIIDAFPVDHSLRAPGSYYDRTQAEQAQQRLLASQPHLPLEQCYVTERTIPDGSISSANLHRAPENKLGVNLSGYLASEKGIGEAARADARALSAAGVPYVLNNVTDRRSVNRKTDDAVFSQDNPFAINLIHVSADTIHDFVRKAGPEYFANRFNIAFWAWELSEFPRHWRTRFDHLNEIWVPSEFVRASVSQHAPVRVRTVPHCVDPSLTQSRATLKTFGLPASPYLFLFAFDFDSSAERKNPLGLIAAFKKAFSPADDAALVLKCSHAEQSAWEFEEVKNAARGARIHVLDCVLDRTDMNALMNLTDCYVSLHRSEGFGLSLAEAMALGKPVIATRYSGNMDFMTPENSFLVPCDLVELTRDVGYYSKGCIWAEPDLDHAARLMRYVFENRDEAGEVGQRARQEILNTLHPDVVGKVMKDRLLAILKDSMSRRPERAAFENIVLENTKSPAARKAPPRSLFGSEDSSCNCSIIVPVYNNSALTVQCLDALLSSPPSASYEIIVVDDASTDSTRDVLSRYGNAVRVIGRKVNSGFANACNEGAGAATGTFLVFLNNDTVPQPGWLDAMVKHALAHPRAGIVGSKLLFPDGTIQHAGVIVAESRYPRHIYVGYPANHPGVNVSRRFKAVTGACMLVKRSFFAKLGGFDPAFTNGFEDVDLCFRAGEQGAEVHYCHESCLIHLQSATRAGRDEEESRNCGEYYARWAHRVKPDRVRYDAQNIPIAFESDIFDADVQMPVNWLDNQQWRSAPVNGACGMLPPDGQSSQPNAVAPRPAPPGMKVL